MHVVRRFAILAVVSVFFLGGCDVFSGLLTSEQPDDGPDSNEEPAEVTDDGGDVVAQVTVAPTSVSATEGGADGSYIVVLSTEPTADVDITPSSSGQLTTSPATLTFTTGNWDTPQTVTVTAVDDGEAEGAHTAKVTHTTASSDADYNAVSVNDVTVNVTDNDAAGVSVTPLTVSASEGGANGSYTVVLTNAPTADVNITPSTSGQLTTSPATLTFTTGNWATPQTVTVTAVDDDAVEGDHSDTVTHSVSSADGDYSGASVSVVTVDITDNDAAGVSVTPLTVSASEGGADGTYTVVLTTEPTADVDITPSSSEQVTTSPETLTFTTGNWDSPQTVTVEAVDDDAVEGDHSDTVTHSATSTDGDYSGGSVSSVTVDITDNDAAENPEEEPEPEAAAGITVTPSSVSATEGGDDGSYEVVLDSEPTADVDMTLSSGGQVTTSPETLTFTTGNWNTSQTVTVTAVDDDAVEGDHSDTVTHSATSTDGEYNGASVSAVTVDITDNDAAENPEEEPEPEAAAGITVTPSSVSATEGGDDGSYEVVLDSEPTADVDITISPGEQVTTSPETLTFTTGNWDSPQTVTVTAVDNDVADGDRTDTVTHAATSTDGDYGGVSVSAVTVNITDNDAAGVSVTSTTVSATEGGDDGSYEVVLDSEPTADVAIEVSSVNNEASVTPTELTFTAADWDSPQTVTVEALDDAVAEGTHSDTVTHEVAAGDGDYVGIVISNVTVNITDNDFTVSFDDNQDYLGDTKAKLFGSAPNDTAAAGGTVTLPGNGEGPFIQGYTFTGWNTAPDGNGTDYAAGATTVMGDTTLYAQWVGGPGNYAAAFSGGSGAAGDPYLVSSAAEFYNMGHRDFIDQNLYFEQTANIDLGVAPWNEGSGWPGVGNIGTTKFNATFDGGVYEITNLTQSTTTNRNGLFSRATGAEFINVALKDVDITSERGFTGALLGAGDSLGDTTITDSYATGTIVIDDTVFGGTADTDDRNVGGLVGYGKRTIITGSFADVVVTNTGNATGGLVGWADSTSSIDDSYALGDVTGDDTVGGLVGSGGATIDRSYSAGAVTGTSNVGGLIGAGAATNSYYDQDASGQSDNDGRGRPKSQADMLNQTTFQPGNGNWDFTSIWDIVEDSSYPYHEWYTGPVPTP